MFKSGIMLLLVGLLQACAPIDNYLLGQDNTPVPGPLPSVHARLTLTEQWSVSLGKSIGTSGVYLKLKPCIQDNTVYAANPNGHLMAINKHTGAVYWSTQLPRGVISGPVLADGLLVLGTNNSELIAVDSKSGALRWQKRVSGDVLASPLMTHGLVIAKTIDGHLIALDAMRGHKRWEIDHGSPHLILKASASPVQSGSLVLVGFSDGRLDAVDLVSGRVVWQRSIAYATGASDVERLVDIDADPVVRDGVIYIATYQGYLSALGLNDSELLWNKSASTYKNLALDAASIYLSDSDDVIWSIARSNGQVRWKQSVLAARNLTAPVRMGSWLLVGDKTGWLHALDAHQGELIGRVNLHASIDTEPQVSDNRVYVVANGQLVCFSVGK